MTLNSAKESNFFENLRKVITLVDRLRDIGLHEYINLPRIAVLGTQSSGKSSLLEQIVGLDCLPRGDGVVTRRPLELRLVYKSPVELKKPYGVFDEIPGQQFPDFEQVKLKINELTDKIAGTSKDIVDKPIILTIYSSSCPDLTLIDLPGITRIPIAGQNKNIYQITKGMVTRYCSNPQTIILCVVPANQDMSTSEALLIAQELDPSGQRTLGVITKIDIMDKGTNAKAMISNQEIQLRYGYVGIKCRSQQDIKDGKPVSKALEEEKKYFSSNPVYSSLPSGMTGTFSLTVKLSTILYKHIRGYMPELVKELQKRIYDQEIKLQALGECLPDSEVDKTHFLWKVTHEFCISYKNSIAGNYDKTASANANQLPAGSKIRRLLSSLFENYQKERPTNKYKDEDIKRAILLHEGESIPGFPSIDAFLYLLSPLLEQIKDPANECINEVYSILEETCQNILDKMLVKIPSLKEDLLEVILKFIQELREKTKEVVEEIIQSEIGYIFTNDNDYLTNKLNLLPEDPKARPDEKKAEPTLVTELRSRIDQYFLLVIRGSRDTIPKLIGFNLVKASQVFRCSNKKGENLAKFVSKDLFQYRISQNNPRGIVFINQNKPRHIVEDRKMLSKQIEVMKSSLRIIRQDPDLARYGSSAEDEERLLPIRKSVIRQKTKQDQPQAPAQQQYNPPPQQTLVTQAPLVSNAPRTQPQIQPQTDKAAGFFGIPTTNNNVSNSNQPQRVDNPHSQPQPPAKVESQKIFGQPQQQPAPQSVNNSAQKIPTQQDKLSNLFGFGAIAPKPTQAANDAQKQAQARQGGK